jgi:sugar (pentulose or hexulose) kinase
VLHDESPKRLTGQRAPAAEQTARELLDAPLRADPDERLLLLDEALALLAGRALLDIEVKPDPGASPDELAARVGAALARAGDPPAVVVTSESEEILAALARALPGVPRGLVFRTFDRRDPLAVARRTLCSLLVPSARRVSEKLAAAAREANLGVWAYTVNDAAEARRLFALGCHALFTDDWPRMQGEVFGAEEAGGGAGARAAREPIAVLDLGSSSMKAALVDPAAGVVASVSAPTPTAFPAPGLVEHDPRQVEAAARALLERLADGAPGVTPAAFGLASQRSTGLWAHRSTLDPLTPAVSWRDRRGAELVAGLSASAAELESIALLPLDPAWTAVKGRALLGLQQPGWDDLLAPLGSWLGSVLTGAIPRVDPTLANRMFLVDARHGGWSPDLLAAFGLATHVLPRLVPTVDDHGALPWPGGGPVPWTALVGDQQAAYVGAVGPLAERLVLNVGTAGFAMRAGRRDEPLPHGGRRAPLWTSRARPEPAAWLIEVPVVPPAEGGLTARTVDGSARELARRVALGDGAPAAFARRVAEALRALSGPAQQTVAVTGGGVASPQLLSLLAEAFGGPLAVAKQPEATLLGTARLAAAGAKVPWALRPGGGYAPFPAD